MAAPSKSTLPIAVDLDGTLLKVDTLHEGILATLKEDLWQIGALLRSMLKGRAAFKRHVAEAARPDWSTVPARPSLVKWLEEQHAAGRRIVLVTAADEIVAREVARRFPFISDVIASDGRRNLKGKNKAELLAKKFPGGFEYIGDSVHDIHVWKVSVGGRAYPRTKSLDKHLKRTVPVIESIRETLPFFFRWRRTLRLHQWVKNLLVFVPVLLGGAFRDPQVWGNATVCFGALGLMASGTYVFNDLWDLAGDRQHWSKKHRPLASGDMSIALAAVVSPLLIVAGLILSAFVNYAVVGFMLTYLVLTLSYSLRFKREPIIDVFLLACLFTLRLGIGIAAAGVKLSPWLLVFSMFLFLSLSIAKRSTEVGKMQATGTKLQNRGYRAEDQPLIVATGLAAAFGAILVMILYLITDAFPANFYKRPVFLWVAPMILFLWISRVWLLCGRGELHDDPVSFALKDRLSLLYAAILGIAFMAGIA